jgi:LmbE family N-acetylglucosaminyl deacetylase
MLPLTHQRVLAVAPHIDDVELGAGAIISRLTKTNDVYYVGLSLPPLVDAPTFMAEFEESSAILGLKRERIIIRNHDPRDLFSTRSDILQLFYDLYRDIKPSLVIMPNGKDIHQSHEVVHAEARRAFKYTTMIGYELPWNCMDFSMDVFITVTHEEVAAKVAAINAFKTQKHRLFFSNDIVADLARVRGKQIGREYAECFELVRLIT